MPLLQGATHIENRVAGIGTSLSEAKGSLV